MPVVFRTISGLGITLGIALGVAVSVISALATMAAGLISIFVASVSTQRSMSVASGESTVGTVVSVGTAVIAAMSVLLVTVGRVATVAAMGELAAVADDGGAVGTVGQEAAGGSGLVVDAESKVLLAALHQEFFQENVETLGR